MLVSELRARLGAMERARELLPCSWLPEGLPKGGLVEIAGHGKTEAVARLLAEHDDLPAAWVEKRFSLFPPAFLQRKRRLQKLFFVEGKQDSSWAAATLLRSQLFPILVYDAPYGEERELRRFQLLAERSRTTMLLLAPGKPCSAWPIALSLELHQGRATVLRKK